MTVKLQTFIVPVVTITLLVVASIAGINWYSQNSLKSLTLTFVPIVDKQPLVFNQLSYSNPGGPGLFKVRDFQFYISNIKLISDDEEYVEHDSYHLVRFDSEDGRYIIELKDIVNSDYHTIEFGIGVDKAANSSIESKGDLDPNSRMAWSWDVGYKFILFEGGLEIDGTLYPLVYHVGFNENYKVVKNSLSSSLFETQKASIDLVVDVMKVFNAKSELNMAELSSIKFDQADASFLANNYATMITIVNREKK